MASTNGVLDTGVEGSNGLVLPLTNETLITVYIIGRTGKHDNHVVALEFSPDGTTFVQDPNLIVGTSHKTFHVCAAAVQLKVVKSEETESSVTAHILAR